MNPSDWRAEAERIVGQADDGAENDPTLEDLIASALSAVHAAGAADARALLAECLPLLDLLPPGRYGQLRERIDRHLEANP